MGLSNLTSHILLFTAILLICTGMVIVLREYIGATGNAILLQQESLSDRFKTDIKIESVGWDNTTDPLMNQTVVYVRNLGTSLLDPERVYVYLDGRWIPSHEQNMTAFVVSDLDRVNIGLLDQKEILEIHIYGNLDSTLIHALKVTVEYGVSDSVIFSI